MEEEITRAAPKTTAAQKKTSSSTSSKRKTSSTASSSKRKTSSSSSKKKPASSTAKKKTSSSTALKLTAAEKKLITNYRKCGTLQKQIIALVIEKVAGGTTKLEGIERLINDQSSVL